MHDQLEALEREHAALEVSLADPEVLADQARYTAAARRYHELDGVVALVRRQREVAGDLAAARELLAEAGADERSALEGEIARAEADLDAAGAERRRIEQLARATQQRLAQARWLARERRERIENDALPLAEKVAASADLAYRRGAGSVLELLDALRQLRALQLEALGARLDEDRADAASRAEMLTAAAADDPIFGESLRLRPTEF